MTYIISGSDRPKPGVTRATTMIDSSVHLGVVHEELAPGNTGETLYVVMVTLDGQDVPITCSRMHRFGGAHNYEEFTLRGYNDSSGEGRNKNFSQRPGDVVVVAFLDGVAKQGLILGGIRHPSRKQEITPSDIAYKSRFNGIETEIKKDGSASWTYKGIVEEPALALPPTGTPIPPVKDDEEKAGSTFGFDVDGNFNISDGDRQSILIKRNAKEGGDITITSGTTVIKIAGGDNTQTIDLTTKGNVGIAAEKDISITSKGLKIDSSKKIEIKASSGLSIESAGAELLDQLVTLIDELGTLIVTSPVGPCSALQAAPTWAKVTAVQTKIKKMIG